MDEQMQEQQSTEQPENDVTSSSLDDVYEEQEAPKPPEQEIEEEP